jgi:hypothetical protein
MKATTIKAVEECQKIWELCLSEQDKRDMHSRRAGIRSTQILALIQLLIDLDIITEEKLAKLPNIIK